MATLLDTGPLYAAVDRTDDWHSRVVDYLDSEPGALVVPEIVLPEVTYLILTRIGAAAELAFIRSINEGEIGLELQVTGDYRRAQDILEEYSDQAFGLVDAVVMATAERLRIRRIVTLDRRDFSCFRPKHCSHFDLLP